MTQKLDLNECLINRINYSLSFSVNNGILSVKKVSYEPLWKKIGLTSLLFIPTIGFTLATLYCIYAITVDTQYASNCSEALPLLILITIACLLVVPSIDTLYSSKSSLDNSRYSFMGVFVSRKILVEYRKPILTLEVYASPLGGQLEGKIRIQRKRNFLPWDIHVSLFQKITYPSKEIACKNASMIKEFISKNANSLFSYVKIEYYEY